MLMFRDFDGASQLPGRAREPLANALDQANAWIRAHNIKFVNAETRYTPATSKPVGIRIWYEGAP